MQSKLLVLRLKWYKKFGKIVFSLGFFLYLLFFIIETARHSEQYANASQVNDTPLVSNPSQEIYGVAKVIDGDSLYVDKKEVRLLDIDAPEYKQECFDKNNKPYRCGIVSSKFLRKFIQNKNITCKYNQKDRYNRLLARCYMESISINEKMILSGMAVIYDLSQAYDKIISLEKEAKATKLGIWQGHFQLPKDYRKSLK